MCVFVCFRVQVQDDLQLLRNTVARASDGAVDLTVLDSVLSRTERGVQVSTVTTFVIIAKYAPESTPVAF